MIVVTHRKWVFCTQPIIAKYIVGFTSYCLPFFYRALPFDFFLQYNIRATITLVLIFWFYTYPHFTQKTVLMTHVIWVTLQYHYFTGATHLFYTSSRHHSYQSDFSLLDLYYYIVRLIYSSCLKLRLESGSPRSCYLGVKFKWYFLFYWLITFNKIFWTLWTYICKLASLHWCHRFASPISLCPSFILPIDEI